jgi:hypothetical protein
MATVDLWPDEITTDGGLEVPTVLLKEQAALLGQKTKNLVEAEVQSLPEITKKGSFIDGFSITSPTLNYRYPLFQVNYPLELYPALVVWEGYESGYDEMVGTTPARRVKSKEELQFALQEIFSAERTVRMVQALKARSRS